MTQFPEVIQSGCETRTISKNKNTRRLRRVRSYLYPDYLPESQKIEIICNKNMLHNYDNANLIIIIQFYKIAKN